MKQGHICGVIRFPYPVFNFISFDIVLEPEIVFLKFPVTQGEKWEQAALAKANIFGFFTVEKNITMTFEVVKKGFIEFAGERKEAFLVAITRDEGDGTIVKEKSWYTEGIGYSGGESPEYTIKLSGFFPGSEGQLNLF